MHKVFLDLPAGTVVFQHRAGVTFTFSWQSTEGVHIVRSAIPVDWNEQAAALEKIAGAVRDFTLAVALEVLNGYTAQRESER